MKSTIEYTDEAWAQLEQQRSAMLESRIDQLVNKSLGLQKEAAKLRKEIVEIVGDGQKANERILLSLAKLGGPDGIALSDVRWHIPEPSQLTATRESLREPKDEAGKTLPPLIREDRGENNEMRIYLVSTSPAAA